MKLETYTGPYFQKTNHHMYIKPAKELCDMIAHYTITFASSLPVECENYHILPDASGCFIFQENDTLRHDFWGPMSEIVVLENDLKDAPERFFVEFLPSGLYQTTGLSQRDYVNRRASMTELDEDIAKQLIAMYKQCTSYDELIVKLNTWFIEQRKKHNVPARCQRILAYIDEQKGSIGMETIAQREQVSKRQLLRDFEKYIGLTIKEYANIVRFHHTLDLIEEDDLTYAAIHGGYFDQSHFNKVFKKITKTNPKRYLENMSDFYKEIYKF